MKSGEWRARDEAILAHVGRYRITIRVVLEHLFFGDRPSGNVVQRLLRDGRIQTGRSAHGRLSYYQLTVPEALRQRLPADRGRPFGARALHTHLALLWACCMAPVRRRRVELDEVRRLFGDVLSDAPHLAEDAEKARVFRTYVVAAQTRLPALIKRLRGELQRSIAHPTLGRWVASGTYAFVMLSDTPTGCQAVDRALKRAKLGDTALIRSEVGASPLTILEMLRERRQQTSRNTLS